MPEGTEQGQVTPVPIHLLCHLQSAELCLPKRRPSPNPTPPHALVLVTVTLLEVGSVQVGTRTRSSWSGLGLAHVHLTCPHRLTWELT